MRPFSFRHFKTSVTINRTIRNRSDVVGGVVVDSNTTSVLNAAIHEDGEMQRVENMDNNRVEFRQKYRLGFQSNPSVSEGDTITWSAGIGLVFGPAVDAGSQGGCIWWTTVEVVT